MEIFKEYQWVLYILQGVGLTLQYAVSAFVIGLLAGIMLTALRLTGNRFLDCFSKAYISIMRGTPILLQLSIIYYALPNLLDYLAPGVFENKISPFIAGMIAFSMNSSAYVAEIIRSGILAVDKGQLEAAAVLKVPYYMTMRDIVLPQALRNVMPALVNEATVLVKETSLVAIIGEGDLMRRAQIVAAEQYSFFGPLLVAGCCYYVIVWVINHFSKIIEVGLHAKYWAFEQNVE